MFDTDHYLASYLLSKVLHSLENSVQSSVQSGAFVICCLRVAKQELEIVSTGKVNFMLEQKKTFFSVQIWKMNCISYLFFHQNAIPCENGNENLQDHDMARNFQF
jgi:hypothetical protein